MRANEETGLKAENVVKVIKEILNPVDVSNDDELG